MGEKVNFSISIPWLCEYYIQIEYENMCKLAKTEDQKKIYLFPLWNEIIKKDVDFTDKLDCFVKNVLQHDTKNKLLLTDYVMSAYAKWIIDTEYKKRESYIIRVRSLEKINRVKEAIKEAKKNHKYFVYDKNTEKLYDSKIGGHWNAIKKALSDIFGYEKLNDESNWGELDQYIKDNLYLHGIFYCDEHYRLKTRKENES